MRDRYQVYCELEGADNCGWWRLVYLPFVPQTGISLRFGGHYFCVTFVAWSTEHDRFDVGFEYDTPSPEWLEKHGWQRVVESEPAHA